MPNPFATAESECRREAMNLENGSAAATPGGQTPAYIGFSFALVIFPQDMSELARGNWPILRRRFTLIDSLGVHVRLCANGR